MSMKTFSTFITFSFFFNRWDNSLDSKQMIFEALLKKHAMKHEENQMRQDNCRNSQEKQIERRTDRILGKGSFGFVYASAEGNLTAVKVLLNYYNSPGSNLSSFFRTEFASLETLSFHPNIVQLIQRQRFRPSLELLRSVFGENEESYDYFLEPRNPRFPNEPTTAKETIAMELEYIPWNLAEFMEMFGSFWKNCHVYEFCLQISRGISFLYDNKMVHLDLKLDNILVTPCVQMVICDFSTAKLFEHSFKEWISHDEAPGGNPLHLALELFKAPRSGNRKKLDYTYQPSFALGVIFFELATGRLPFTNYPEGRGANSSLPSIDYSLMERNYDPRFVSLVRSLITEHTPRPLPRDIIQALEILTKEHPFAG